MTDLLIRRRGMALMEKGLPSAYTRLTYVSNQGAAYFSTGKSVTGNMTFDVNFLLYAGTSSNNFAMFGGGQHTNQDRNSIGVNMRSSSVFDIQYLYRRQVGGVYLTRNVWYNVQLKDDGFYLNNSLALAITRRTFTGADKFYIGSYSYYSSRPAFMYIGVCKVNNDEYIPVKRNSDDVAGFYCMQNKTFYTSTSSTPFLAGDIYIEE